MPKQSRKNLWIKNILLSLVCALLAAGVCSAQSVLYFPQFADGSQSPATGVAWVTGIVVTNSAAPGSPAATGTVSMTNADGTAMAITLADENGNNPGNTFQLAAGQTQFFISPQGNSDNPLPFNTGFATVTSNFPVIAESVFIEAGQKGPIAIAGMPGSQPLTRQALLAVKDENSATAVAVANPGADAATITFQLLNKSGAPMVPAVTQTLAANNQKAFFLSDLFPAAPSTYYGRLRVTSDNGIVTTALLFQGATFGTLPVIPLL